MRRLGAQLWLIQQGTDAALDMALFVRDVLALSVTTEPDIPLLDPSVPVALPSAVDRPAVAAEWSGWWVDAVAAAGDQEAVRRQRRPFDPSVGEGDHLVLGRRPAVRIAVAALETAAARYFAGAQRRLGRSAVGPPGIGDLVKARELELGRAAKPFQLVVTELPVAGLLCHRQAVGHVLMSVRFANDVPRRDAVLREIIAELA